VLVGKGREGEGEREGRGEYGFQVRFLQADVEEPEVLVELDFGGHGEERVVVGGRLRVREVD